MALTSAPIVRLEGLSYRYSGASEWALREIDIRIEVTEKERKRLERALERFTDFCIISESIRGSFPITTRVHHPWGVHYSVLE